MQTEALLEQSQKIAAELQAQQKELQQTNEQLAQKAQQLADQNAEVERKNQQIEQARRALEEKAEELALTSKYKSEFLANMSHELRTPLNSHLILGQQLAENPEQNLTAKQVEFARTIHSAGTDLLNLISDILDLSKIESGTVTVEPADVYFSNLLDTVARPFRHDAETRGLSFEVSLDPRPGAQPLHRPEAPAAGPQEPPLQRLQVHRARRRAPQGVARPRPAGPASIRSSISRRWWWGSRCPTPASESRRRSRRSSSRPSSRPTPAPPASTAAPDSGWPSAASCPTCSAARSSCGAPRAGAAPSPSTCPSATSARRATCARRRGRRWRRSARPRACAWWRPRRRRSCPTTGRTSGRGIRASWWSRTIRTTPASWRTSPGIRGSRCSSPAGAPRRWSWPGSSVPARSPSTCSSPTCWGGPSSAT